MESRKWLNMAFDRINFGVKLNEITQDVPEVMLMGTGTTRTNIRPKGEDERLKKSYNISRIVSKGTNKYELKFNDVRSSNLARE